MNYFCIVKVEDVVVIRERGKQGDSFTRHVSLRAPDREDGGGVRELVQWVITRAAARCRDAGVPLLQSWQ